MELFFTPFIKFKLTIPPLLMCFGFFSIFPKDITICSNFFFYIIPIFIFNIKFITIIEVLPHFFDIIDPRLNTIVLIIKIFTRRAI